MVCYKYLMFIQYWMIAITSIFTAHKIEEQYQISSSFQDYICFDAMIDFTLIG